VVDLFPFFNFEFLKSKSLFNRKDIKILKSFFWNKATSAEAA
jgi:hypothetical protein